MSDPNRPIDPSETPSTADPIVSNKIEPVAESEIVEPIGDAAIAAEPSTVEITDSVGESANCLPTAESVSDHLIQDVERPTESPEFVVPTGESAIPPTEFASVDQVSPEQETDSPLPTDGSPEFAAEAPPSLFASEPEPDGEPEPTSAWSEEPQAESASAEPEAVAEPLRARGRNKTQDVMRLAVLYTWAGVASILAFWFWWTRPDPEGPLENIQDDGKYRQSAILDPFNELIERQIVGIGQTKRFGHLEVTPVSIENRPVKILPVGNSTAPCLALKVRLKNISTNSTFRATDPVFSHLVHKRLKGFPVRNGYGYTFIQPIGRSRELVPPYDLDYEAGGMIEGENFDPLAPGAESETIFVSAEGAIKRLDGPMLWRVKLRKGKDPEGVGVATVIAVRFTKEDVKTP